MSRYYDVQCEVTFLGRVYAPTARDGAAHAKAVIGRRLLSANVTGDKEFTVDGFVSHGIVLSATTARSQRAERALLRALALKHPDTALAALAQVLTRKKETRR